MSNAQQCAGSDEAPLEVAEAPGGKTVGRCSSCRAFVYLLTSGLVKKHKLPRSQEIDE